VVITGALQNPTGRIVFARSEALSNGGDPAAAGKRRPKPPR
jgi:hypothetical protein